MSISSIFNSASSILDISQLLGSQPTGTASQATAASTNALSSTSDSSSISQFGQLLSQLQNLQTSDPSKFKQLMMQEAAKLQAAAQKAGANTPEGQTLTSEAQKFTDVAIGGNLSELQPSGHHHHHHGSGGAQSIYNQTGQISGTQSVATPSAGSTNSSVSQVMQGIFSDLEQAVQS